MPDLVGKTIKAVHTDYAWKRPCPWLGADFDPNKVIGAKFEQIDGVWHRDTTSDILIEFTDGTRCVFEAGFYGDPIEVDMI
jgi:hypothetical protein